MYIHSFKINIIRPIKGVLNSAIFTGKTVENKGGILGIAVCEFVLQSLLQSDICCSIACKARKTSQNPFLSSDVEINDRNVVHEFDEPGQYKHTQLTQDRTCCV